MDDRLRDIMVVEESHAQERYCPLCRPRDFARHIFLLCHRRHHVQRVRLTGRIAAVSRQVQLKLNIPKFERQT